MLQLCAILPPKMQGEWTEPPWMTSLKRLGKDLGLDDPTEPQQCLESPNQPQHVEALGTAHSSGGVEVVPLGTAHSSGLEVPRASPAEKDIPPALPQGQPEAQSVEPREVVSSPAASTSHVSPVKLETQKIDHLKEEKQEIEDKQDRFSILTVVHDNLRHSEEDISSACPNDPGNNRRLHKKSSAKKVCIYVHSCESDFSWSYWVCRCLQMPNTHCYVWLQRFSTACFGCRSRAED